MESLFHQLQGHNPDSGVHADHVHARWQHRDVEFPAGSLHHQLTAHVEELHGDGLGFQAHDAADVLGRVRCEEDGSVELVIVDAHAGGQVEGHHAVATVHCL